MIDQYEKDEKRLQEYADTHDIRKMNSEDLMKLFEYPYIISQIARAFHLTEDMFKKIKEEKKIFNIYLERSIRNMDSILFHIDSKYSDISDRVRNKIIKFLIFPFSDYPNSEFYQRKLSEIDFNKNAVIEDIKRRDIDVEYRLRELFLILPDFDSLIEYWMETDIEKQIQVEVEGKKYQVIFSNEKYEVKKSTSTRKNNGSKRNQKKENESKISSGKIGEQIVLKAEKICIEVKTNKGKRDKPFFISDKEIEVLNGIKEEYDCEHCLIYYVLVDEDMVTIKKINYMDFNTYKLKAVLYKIEET